MGVCSQAIHAQSGVVVLCTIKGVRRGHIPVGQELCREETPRLEPSVGCGGCAGLEASKRCSAPPDEPGRGSGRRPGGLPWGALTWT